MKIEFNVLKGTGYSSPSVSELMIDSEGLLCASAVNESFTEDDDWGELLD